jgi:hypothetical protein
MGHTVSAGVDAAPAPVTEALHNGCSQGIGFVDAAAFVCWREKITSTWYIRLFLYLSGD